MFSRDLTIAKYDADLFAAMQQEAVRQEEHIELIASENYTSPAVMEAQGSVLTNKYAEGYPGKRYYGGCEYVDVVEQLAISRAKELFGADYANVQPHAGSQDNSAVYLALLQGGDTILGMSLAHGGHLTHGASVSSSGKLYNAVQYGIDANGLIDQRLVLGGQLLAPDHFIDHADVLVTNHAFGVDKEGFRSAVHAEVQTEVAVHGVGAAAVPLPHLPDGNGSRVAVSWKGFDAHGSPRVPCRQGVWLRMGRRRETALTSPTRSLSLRNPSRPI